jgi:hypothetical protein
MQRHLRDRDMLWLTSGLPFLTWASASASRSEPDTAPIACAAESRDGGYRARDLREEVRRGRFG